MRTHTRNSGLIVPGADPIRWNPPKGWREDYMGQLVCPHRDKSVCRECDEATPEAVETVGAHFWIATAEDRAALAAEFADV